MGKKKKKSMKISVCTNYIYVLKCNSRLHFFKVVKTSVCLNDKFGEVHILKEKGFGKRFLLSILKLWMEINNIHLIR